MPGKSPAFRWRAVAALLMVLCLPALTAATTILARTDAELVALSDRVIRGRVVGIRVEPRPGGLRTVSRIAVLEDFTGGGDRIIEVTELGGEVAGRGMWVPGAPRFAIGQHVVLCLEAAGGTWRTIAMAYSAFDVQRDPATGDEQLERFGGDYALAGVPSASAVTARRSLPAFRQTVARVKGVAAVLLVEDTDADRMVATAASALDGRVDEGVFTLLGGGIRWREVDSGQPVLWYRNASYPSPLVGADIDQQMHVATSAWTAVIGAAITVTYAGTRGATITTPELDYCSSVNAGAGLVTFEDPARDMALGSGVLAIGGGCYSETTTVVNGHQFRTFTHGYVIFNEASSLAGYTTVPNFTRILTHEIGHGIGLGHDNTDQTSLMYPSCCTSSTPVPPALGAQDVAGLVFIYPEQDDDNDGLPDAWERRFGLSTADASGANGPSGDPDGDGVTNRQELEDGTHPRGFFTRYLAEGAVNAFFGTELAFFAYDDVAARIHVRVQPEGQTERAVTLSEPFAARRTLSSTELAALTTAPFSTVVESDRPVVVDRTMRWDPRGYGTHAETAVVAPSTTWYLAEGSTSGEFSLFYLLQNPQPGAVTATVRFLRPAPHPPIERVYSLPPRSRTTIPVDTAAAEVASTDVSGVVTASLPIIVERAMYLSRPDEPFAAGHASAGVTTPATEWFLAEGATGSFFELFVLIANPNPTASEVTVDYLLPDGTVVVKAYTVAGDSRFTIWVDNEEFPAGSGNRRLANASLAMRVHATNGVPIVVERAMWWPQPAWYESHHAPGLTATGTRWALAAGEVGGAAGADTYVLIANSSAFAGQAQVTVFFEQSTETATLVVDLPANSRTNVSMRELFPATIGRRFATLVESLGATPAQLAVERAMYTSPGGVLWAAGTAAVATRITP